MWFRFFHFCSFDPLPLHTSVSLASPQLQILHELLHCHLIQEHKVRFPELQALQRRHPSLPWSPNEPKNVL